jgi:hypothetical protein
MNRIRLAASAAAITVASGLVLGAATPAGADDIAAPGSRTEAYLPPTTINLIVAIVACREMYPPGTDITRCIDNLS